MMTKMKKEGEEEKAISGRIGGREKEEENKGGKGTGEQE